MKNVLYVNKPQGITSFTLCNKLRPVFGTRAIGHTGTLDPMATGVMIILLNKATKANQFLTYDDKEYIGEMTLGKETSTLDKEGEVVDSKVINDLSFEAWQEVMNSFIGKSKQLPPLTSAIKVKGKKLYEYQREGKEVEIPLRDIEIKSIELLNKEDNVLRFKVSVSSGTYIRSLVRDLAYKTSNLAYLSSLTRTRVGSISLKDCDDFDEVLKGNYKLHEVNEVLSNLYPTIEVNNPNDIKNGKRIKIDSDAARIFLTYDNEALAIYEKDGDEYRSVRGLF